MIIGIDLDGVIVDTEMSYRVEAELYDMQILKKGSLIRPEEQLIFKRYDWNEMEQQNFSPILEKSARNCNVMPGAKRVIDLLKADGNKLILISSRGHENKVMQEIGMESLKKYDIYLDKYYLGIKDKLAICKQENVDVMIDDNYRNCLKVSEGGILTLYFVDGGMKNLEENDKLKMVYNWGEIYRIITKLERGIAK